MVVTQAFPFKNHRNEYCCNQLIYEEDNKQNYILKVIVVLFKLYFLSISSQHLSNTKNSP